MKTAVITALLVLTAASAHAQSIYGPNGGRSGGDVLVYTTPAPPPPPTMNDWQRFQPGNQQFTPPPAPQMCHVNGNIMICR